MLDKKEFNKKEKPEAIKLQVKEEPSDIRFNPMSEGLSLDFISFFYSSIRFHHLTDTSSDGSVGKAKIFSPLLSKPVFDVVRSLTLPFSKS